MRPTLSPRLALPVLAAAHLLAAPAARAQTAEAPRTHAPRPTVAAITPADLRTRLYALADDSLKGRLAGSEGNFRATAMIAAEFRRLGLEPAGENGTFFQAIPLVRRAPDPASALTVDGAPLELWRDFAPLRGSGQLLPFGRELRAQGVPVVYGGRVGAQVITPEQAAGKVVVFAPPLGASGQPDFRFWSRSFWPGGGLAAYRDAAAIVVASLDISPPPILAFAREPETELAGGTAPPRAPVGILVTPRAAERLLGAPLAGLAPGAAGKAVSGTVRFAETPVEHPARNVVAVLRGSDPALRGSYVALSAHNDHVGVIDAVDHDSLRVFNRVMAPEGANSDPGEPTPEQAARIRAALDSVRRLRPARLDSIANGADDDGSGTVTLLEIAETMARAPQRPRRSVLFVSHTAEELGLYGSQHFSDHPTVPRDSIMALLNMDMVGRGRAEDIMGGGPSYLQIIGSRRLSTGLGELIDAVNGRRAQPMRIDYTFDAPGHPYNRYCRSDHFMYARHGIPISYFSRGYHVDYHMASDEPQYIDYDGMANVGGFLHEVLLNLANLPQRLVVDGKRQDPNAPCRQ